MSGWHCRDCVARPRVDWTCDGCRRRFLAHTVVKSQQSCKSDDRVYTVKWCPTCVAMAAEMFRLDSDYLYGITDDHLHEWMRENHGSWAAADAHYATQETPDA